MTSQPSQKPQDQFTELQEAVERAMSYWVRPEHFMRTAEEAAFTFFHVWDSKTDESVKIFEDSDEAGEYCRALHAQAAIRAVLDGIEEPDDAAVIVGDRAADKYVESATPPIDSDMTKVGFKKREGP